MKVRKYKAYDNGTMYDWDFVKELNFYELEGKGFVFVQQIGRKDIKGAELCEGDRVRFIAIEDERKGHKTEYKGTIEWDDEDCGFYILNDSDKWPHIKFWYTESIEKIGSRFTPDLLTPSK